MENLSGWIKLYDSSLVRFPEVCPFSGKETNRTRLYVVENTSVFWIFMRILRIGQYLNLDVPVNEQALKAYRKMVRRAIFIGLAIGFGIALIILFSGAYLSAYAETKRMQDVWIMISGISFLGVLIIIPLVLAWRVKRKAAPLFFRMNGKELWVKIRDTSYRSIFRDLNEDNLKGGSEEVLDSF